MTQASSAKNKVRQEAREAAERLERTLPHEGSTSLPFASGMQISSNAMKHWMETSQDLFRFYNHRVAKDFAYVTDLAGCRTPGDVAQLWRRAASETVHDYADQVDRVMAISLNGAAEEGATTSK